jgi:hypothetical protein
MYVSSCVLVPNDPRITFKEIYMKLNVHPIRIFVNAATSNDVIVIAALTRSRITDSISNR